MSRQTGETLQWMFIGQVSSLNSKNTIIDFGYAKNQIGRKQPFLVADLADFIIKEQYFSIGKYHNR